MGWRRVRSRALASRALAYVAVTKPRIVLLLLVTTAPAMLLAGARPSPGRLGVVLLSGAMAASGANALNCYLDRDLDALMRRTRSRPIPSGTLAPGAALGFGFLLAGGSLTLMVLQVNPLAATLTALAIADYDLGYTLWLKRSTPWSTFWGATCGAAPVLIGWAAVTGSLAAPAWLMFAIVFFWQPLHFHALALGRRDDYAAAAIPTFVVVAGPRRVAARVVWYAWLTVLASLLLWALGMSPLYGIVVLVAAVALLSAAHGMLAAVLADRPYRPMRLFRWSNAYLAVVFAAIALDAVAR